jgi:molybdopterin-guanine dinucleotide biosynthesis protein A
MKKPSEPDSGFVSSEVQAFVLAGARAAGDALAIAHNVPSKAHIQIAGRSMISRVLEALSRSDTTKAITIIGLEEGASLSQAETWPPVRHQQGAPGPAASVYGALGEDGEDDEDYPILVTTCDHALLTPEIVDTFLRESLQSSADLTVALARRTEIEAVYPDVHRTYLKFGDAHYSSCNLFCLRTPAAREVVGFWRAAEEDRKRPWRIAWRFGLIRALRLLIGRPPLPGVFEIVSGRLGVDVKPVVLPFADAAVDVDTPDDLALVERVIAERGA